MLIARFASLRIQRRHGLESRLPSPSYRISSDHTLRRDGRSVPATKLRNVDEVKRVELRRGLCHRCVLIPKQRASVGTAGIFLRHRFRKAPDQAESSAREGGLRDGEPRKCLGPRVGSGGLRERSGAAEAGRRPFLSSKIDPEGEAWGVFNLESSLRRPSSSLKLDYDPD